MSVPAGIVVVVRPSPREASVCWLCDHPGATELDYQDHLRQLIDTFGWAVQGVERDGIHPPWAYTVGLTPHRRPELVITGMGLTRATQVLNGVAAHLLHAAAPEPGTQAVLLDGPLVEVVRVATPWAHLTMAVEFYGQPDPRPATGARRQARALALGPRVPGRARRAARAGPAGAAGPPQASGLSAGRGPERPTSGDPSREPGTTPAGRGPRRRYGRGSPRRPWWRR